MSKGKRLVVPRSLSRELIVIAIAFVFLASCATMRNGDTRPTEGLCMEKYDSAKRGEKEMLAGTILLPSGIAIAIAPWIAAFASKPADSVEAIFISGAVLSPLGGVAAIAGLFTLLVGNHNVHDWNDSCTGTTAAERYCLFEPLSEQKQ